MLPSGEGLQSEIAFTIILQAILITSESRALWEQLFTDITQFDDYRYFKAEMGGNSPDFRHKVTDQPLW